MTAPQKKRKSQKEKVIELQRDTRGKTHIT
jgi:hypothetical protein